MRAAPRTTHGVALIPSAGIVEDLVSFRYGQGRRITGPVLGTEMNVPHLTLLQSVFYPDSLTLANLTEALRRFRAGYPGPVEGRFTSAYLQPRDWVFAGVDTGKWGAVLQRAVIAEFEGDIDPLGIDRNRDVGSANDVYRWV
jgi:hypothetical protein